MEIDREHVCSIHLLYHFEQSKVVYSNIWVFVGAACFYKESFHKIYSSRQNTNSRLIHQLCFVVFWGIFLLQEINNTRWIVLFSCFHVVAENELSAAFFIFQFDNDGFCFGLEEHGGVLVVPMIHCFSFQGEMGNGRFYEMKFRSHILLIFPWLSHSYHLYMFPHE